MASRDDETYVIWPIYFDKSVPRTKGRKVAKKYAIEKPQLENIIKAARSLGLNPHVEKTASYPSRSPQHEGRILVTKKQSKTETLKQIAQRL